MFTHQATDSMASVGASLAKTPTAGKMYTFSITTKVTVLKYQTQGNL
jgi:hypothetical protein